jgi:DNA mismatch endonuclease (patch repair protein)
MTDIFTKSKRSKIMSLIRGKGNKDTELAMIDLFRNNKIIGWRRSQSLFGRPDFVFKKKQVAVFVDGCFWHGCYYHGNMPKSNQAFWKNKIEANKKRDRLVTRTLRKQGWKVIRIWEHQLKKLKRREELKNVFEELMS